MKKFAQNKRTHARFSLRIAILALLCVLFATFLSGCMFLRPMLLRAAHQQSDALPTASFSEYAPAPQETPTPLPEVAVSDWGTRPTGSASYLEGRTVLVSIYMNERADWAEDDLAFTQDGMSLAMEYLEARGGEYGHQVELFYDSRQDADLAYFANLPAPDESGDEETHNARVNDWIEQNVDYTGLMERYDADGVGFVLFVNGSGISYTYPYYMGDDAEWFLEKSYLFLHDGDDYSNYETPAVYAHEVMHMFGAVDLYQAMPDDGVTDSLVSYVEDEYPMELMYTTYTADGGYEYDNISSIISPITAYCVGWIDDCDELRMFPSIVREETAAFSSGGYYTGEEGYGEESYGYDGYDGYYGEDSYGDYGDETDCYDGSCYAY